MVMAAWVTVMIILAVMGVFVELGREEAAAAIIGSAMICPALSGLALSCGSLDRRAGNPVLVWVAVAWNVVLTIVWIAFMVIGLTAR